MRKVGCVTRFVVADSSAMKWRSMDMFCSKPGDIFVVVVVVVVVFVVYNWM